MADELAIWLDGRVVAVVERDRQRLRLAYTPAVVSSVPGGTPLLSIQFPVSNRSFPTGVTRAFLDGLLPEGDSRRVIAEEFGLRSNDTFGLIRALGRDSAGALVIQPAEDPRPPTPSVLAAERLSDGELAELVAKLRSAPLGVDERVRISLAGVQEKLALTRLPDGAWGRPVDGAPSTHILKPDIANYPRTVENEVFCMRLARALGLSVASVEMTTVAGRNLIAVERYDRVVDGAGGVRRQHQEDICQAMGLLPTTKYEEDGGPSLDKLARILSTYDPDALPTLVQATTLNVLVGNGDAHGKNFSLTHDGDGRVRLAPLYDVLSTLMYSDERLAMCIDTVQRTRRVTATRIVNEAVSWGLDRDRAHGIVTDLLAQVPDAVAQALAETPDAPQGLLDVIERQLAMLQSQRGR